MLRYLPAFLFTGFVLDIISIVWVGRVAGVGTTLLLLLAGVVAGVLVFRAAGISVATALRAPVQDLSSTRGLAGSTMLRIAAAVLFIVPGFLSDLIAIAFLLPPIQGWLISRMDRVTVSTRMDAQSRHTQTHTTIEGEAVEIDAEILPPDHREGRS